jgi:hypothetical protein
MATKMGFRIRASVRDLFGHFNRDGVSRPRGDDAVNTRVRRSVERRRSFEELGVRGTARALEYAG